MKKRLLERMGEVVCNGMGLTAQLATEAKTETSELTTGENREKALRHGGDAMLEK